MASAARLKLLPNSKRPPALYHFGDVDESLLRILYQQPQQLVLCSAGGENDIALAAADLLERCPVDILATGQCYSAALIVLVSGRFRAATHRTRFLWHPSRICLSDQDKTSAALGTALKELVLSEQAMWEQLVQRTGADLSKWQSLVRGADFYFSSEEARRLGVIHEIIARPPPPRTGPLRASSRRGRG